MPKAILELEMPESCTECMFKECLNRTTSVEVSRCIILHKMHVPGSYCPAEGRQADCPLKLVEAKEVNRMRIFLMNDDYGTVVAAKDEEQAQKYCRGIVFEKKSLEADAAPEPENTNAVTNVKFKKDWLVEDQDEDVGEDDKLKSISIYECCNCHWIFAGDCERYGYGYTSQSVQTPNYCPMCGAKIKDCID